MSSDNVIFHSALSATMAERYCKGWQLHGGSHNVHACLHLTNNLSIAYPCVLHPCCFYLKLFI